MAHVNCSTNGMHSIEELERYQQMTQEEWEAVRRIEVCRCGGKVWSTTWTVDLLSGWYNYCKNCEGPATDPKTNLREFSYVPTGSRLLPPMEPWDYSRKFDYTDAYSTVHYYNPDAPPVKGISNTRSISYEIVPEGAIE